MEITLIDSRVIGHLFASFLSENNSVMLYTRAIKTAHTSASPGLANDKDNE
ncbi:hypothetical protein HMI01_05060 [Halolactibacillus miurensis]|uniref:Uncharacterized protein n=1 Tax=Halolactibacillus miurensis TaxID=306541 RepID=A0A1I6R653_9BACI|nr:MULTISPECIES: hypothetical protein [Halolactibacillus]GEM03518.1 hypothetical protein HMI01_05060 [Halolactibacillus miurensis]SFS60139.1 hypothetical protein SAMN05421668_105170 [Halolactibacillus miurensis]